MIRKFLAFFVSALMILGTIIGNAGFVPVMAEGTHDITINISSALTNNVILNFEGTSATTASLSMEVNNFPSEYTFEIPDMYILNDGAYSVIEFEPGTKLTIKDVPENTSIEVTSMDLSSDDEYSDSTGTIGSGTWKDTLNLGPAPAWTAYTPITGTSTTFSKYVLLEEDAEVPNATFSFSIAPGTAVPSANAVMEIISPSSSTGVTGSPTIANVSFSPSDTKSTTAETGITLNSGQAFAKKTATVDFSGVTFAEPGIFRYVITEAASPVTDEAIFAMDVQKSANATGKTRYLDVYVVDSNDGNKTLSISQYVLHEIASNVTPGSDSGSATYVDTVKSQGFVNQFLSQNVAFAKTVSGNQGSRDKYFKFTVALTGLQASKAYTVDISNADATSGNTTATVSGNRGQTNATTITSDANGAATTYYYLRDGQSVEIKGLPKGATYAVSEDYEDYKQTAGAGTINSVAFNDSATGTINATDIHTGFTNTRNGVVPTGLIVSGTGAIALTGLAIAGMLSKRRKEDEE